MSSSLPNSHQASTASFSGNRDIYSEYWRVIFCMVILSFPPPHLQGYFYWKSSASFPGLSSSLGTVNIPFGNNLLQCSMILLLCMMRGPQEQLHRPHVSSQPLNIMNTSEESSTASPHIPWSFVIISLIHLSFHISTQMVLISFSFFFLIFQFLSKCDCIYDSFLSSSLWFPSICVDCLHSISSTAWDAAVVRWNHDDDVE